MCVAAAFFCVLDLCRQNEAIYNKRVTTVIDSPHFGRVAYVAIGAVCVGGCRSDLFSVLARAMANITNIVGSVQMTQGVGDNVTKGDEMGYFQFGGSTLAVVWQRVGSTGSTPKVAHRLTVRMCSILVVRFNFLAIC